MYDFDSDYRCEAVKLLLSVLPYKNISIIKFMLTLLSHLSKMFNLTQDQDFLEIGYLYILAFINLGFNYSDIESEANDILHDLKISIHDIFIKDVLYSSKIPLTKTSIKRLLGRWPASPHNSHTKENAIKDIIAKVNEGKEGITIYYNSSTLEKTNALYYELIITTENIYFHDINKEKYHIIMRPES